MRSLALSLCLVLAAVSAYAQAPTRYRLERVVVEGARIDEDIIRAETRLEEEKSYTEADFRQAVYRVRRLPFVTDAVYRIEPGVTGGGSTLVIRILAETPFFYELGGGATRGTEGDTETTASLLLGGRWLMDNLGVLEGAVQKEKDVDGFTAGIAYRAYNIYGTGGFASIAAAERFGADPFRYDPSVGLNLGYPLTQRQTITASYSRAKSRLPSTFDVEGDDDDADVSDDEADEDNVTLTQRDRYEFAELRWWYETIDDPIFTHSGVQVSAGPRWSTFEHVGEVYDAANVIADDDVIATETGTSSLGFALDAAGYKPLTSHNSVFLRLGGDYAKTDERTDVKYMNGAARIGFTHDLHANSDTQLRPFKAQFEIGAGYRASIFTPPLGDEVRDTSPFAEAAFVMRHRWGKIRLSAFYDAD